MVRSPEGPGTEFQVEGIGEDFVPRTVNLKIVDEVLNVSDKGSFLMARRLSAEEGILAGGSAGTAVCAALRGCVKSGEMIRAATVRERGSSPDAARFLTVVGLKRLFTHPLRVAARMPKDKLVVVLLPDGGRGYLSKIFNDEWMQSHGYLAPPGHGMTLGDVLDRKGAVAALITVKKNDCVRTAIRLMRDNDISQVPVEGEDGQMVGSIQETTAMQLVFDHVDIQHKPVSEFMGRPFPKMDRATGIEKGFKALSLGSSAIIVREGDQPVGVLTKADFIAYLSGERNDSD